MMVARKSQQNRAKASDTHLQSFIYEINTGLIFIFHVMALVTLSLQLLSLFHSLVADAVNDTAQNAFTRTVRLHI